MTPCTSCGCVWDDSGYYTYKGEIEQPCRECRLNARSIRYLNNGEKERERERTAYYRDVERKREYYRNYRRQQRAQASA